MRKVKVTTPQKGVIVSETSTPIHKATTVSATATEDPQIVIQTKTVEIPKRGDKETKAGYIRRLHRAPYNLEVNQISKATGILYQMVRNVIKGDENAVIIRKVKEATKSD